MLVVSVQTKSLNNNQSDLLQRYLNAANSKVIDDWNTLKSVDEGKGKVNESVMKHQRLGAP